MCSCCVTSDSSSMSVRSGRQRKISLILRLLRPSQLHVLVAGGDIVGPIHTSFKTAGHRVVATLQTCSSHNAVQHIERVKKASRPPISGGRYATCSQTPRLTAEGLIAWRCPPSCGGKFQGGERIAWLSRSSWVSGLGRRKRATGGRGLSHLGEECSPVVVPAGGMPRAAEWRRMTDCSK